MDVGSMGRDRAVVEQRLRSASDSLLQDITFLSDGLKKADDNYQTKFNSQNTSQSMLMHLCWETVEYNTLLQEPNRTEPKDYHRNLFVKKRQPAATEPSYCYGVRGEAKQEAICPTCAVCTLPQHP